ARAGGRAGLGARRDPPTSPSALPWQLLLEPRGRSGPENMALDVALLERADRRGEAFLRLYRFDPPCLSLGRNEAAGGFDRAAIARRGGDVVRRPTGGGSVWHEHDLTNAAAPPIPPFGGRPRAHTPIHAGLAPGPARPGWPPLLPVNPPPPSPNLHHLVFRPHLDLAPLTSPWNLTAPCRPSDRRPV